MNVSSFSISFQGKHIWSLEVLLQSHTKRVSWWCFLNIPSANESNLASFEYSILCSNTVWVSKITHVFLIVFFFFPDTQANIWGMSLSSWFISWAPGYLPSWMFSWEWKSIGPSAAPEVALPSGFRKLGHVLLIQSELLVNLSYVAAWKTIMKRLPLKDRKAHLCGVIFSSFNSHTLTRKSSVYYHLRNIYYTPYVLYSLSLILTRTACKFYFPTWQMHSEN